MILSCDISEDEQLPDAFKHFGHEHLYSDRAIRVLLWIFLIRRRIRREEQDAEHHHHVDSQHRSLIKEETEGMQNQISELKLGMSKLQSASEHLSGRIDAQESENRKLKTELSDWLLQQMSSSVTSERDVVTHPDLQRALEDLEKKILDRLGQERENKEKRDVWRTVGETLQEEGVGAVTVTDVERIVHERLPPQGRRDRNGRLRFGVLQPELYPGKCWPFRGSEGFLVIALSHPVQITHVTLEHLPRVLSPSGHIDSAPKDFAVYGLINEEDKEGKLIGTFSYDQDGETIQTFKVQSSQIEVYSLVELRILSNWGHPEYTCVYRFRVHGQPTPA
ncbi:SUN domain-containing protein 2 [Bagarius yarrelli]|uniref:SUN domain-containing protein 2 n=1 Tax=Bagarius yarrelli TaxID=175774 RepID=A0A556TU29_BAGYA|nr:SUN domain-containing protein 2 [Bagarius yarrelli]